ncbi:MAG: hypothetical protein JNM78_01310 [Cyclobacteriaceae bacterium]|nr:hypothetical protein [Cyclobacteriaceae bacterium]
MRITKLLVGFILFLVSTAMVLPEDDFIQMLIKKMREYKSKAPQVKVFLAFNQNVFAPGDTAFFAVYFLSDDLLPVAGRQVLRVELQNQAGEIMFYEHVGVKEGLGANQVVIPKDLPAGRYQWVSYSEYMKNFDPHFYFRQDFDVVTNYELTTNLKNDLSMNFYPEGGALITSVPNKVIIHSHIKSLGNVSIREEGGDEIVEFFMSKGIHSFSFTPAVNKNYYAQITYNGEPKRFDLPKQQSSGYSIEMESDFNPLKVIVRAPNQTRSQKENLWLVVSAHSEIFYSAPFKFGEAEQVTVQLPATNLPTGIAQVTLFNDQGAVHAERLFFNHPKSPVSVQLSKDKSSYGNRSPVTLGVEIKDELGNPISGNLSISVINKKFLKNETTDLSIASYLQVYSDLPTRENISNFTNNDLDLFMIIQKNKRTDWASILQETKKIKYPFRRMVYYSGRAVYADTGKPVSDSTRIISYLQKNMMGYEAYTDKNGWFDLAFLFDFWNDDNIFYMMENKRGNEIDGRIKWDEDTVRIATTIAMETTSRSAYGEYQLQKRLMDQSFNFYSANADKLDGTLVRDPNADFEDEISGADISVRVQDYVVFPTMEELIREIVPSLQHRRSGGRSTLRVVLSDNGRVPFYDPLILIDGIMTKNTSYFLQLKPSEVISIKVIKDVNKLNRFGSLGKNGIVLVYTKKESHPELQKVNTQLPVKGLNKSASFSLPSQKDLSQLRKPDFKSTLFWNPNVQTDAMGKATSNFYTSDDVGTFLIRIQGITTDGRPFEKTDSLTVSFSGN